MRSVVLVSFLVLRAPENAVVKTEHIEGGHGGNAGHDPSHHWAVGEACRDNLVLGAESREEGDAGDGQTADEERDMRDRHVLVQTAHQCHLIGVHGMDDTTGAEEETSLEHGVGEQVEHTGHVAQLCVVVEQGTVVTGQAHAEGHHHEGNLRDGGEGEHTLDVGLRTSDGGCIESGEDTHPHHNAHGLGSILNPKREHAGQLEDTGHHHRGGVDEGRHRSRTFHGIGQPDVQREHGTLAGATDEHQHKGRRQDKPSGSHGLRCIAGDERRGAVAHDDIGHEGEAERLGVIAEDEDTDKEEHIGKTSDDESLLRSGHCCMELIVETNEQVGAHTHQFPEQVHLENVGGDHQSEHRHGEQGQERIVALEALLTMHVAEGVDVHHQTDRRNDDEHHHRNGVQQDAHVEMQAS